MTSALRWLLVAALCSVAGSGCDDEDFDPYNRLNSLRVLAIQSEPVAPASGETTTLTPLVYTPEEGAELSYAWSWCPVRGSAAEGEGCAIEEVELAALVAGLNVTLPPYDLGTAPTATFTNSFGAELLTLVCGGASAGFAVYDCEHGVPVQISVTVRSGAESVLATRTLRLRAEAAGANQNPLIDGLAIQRSAQEERMDLPEEASADAPELPRRIATPLLIHVPDGIQEHYLGRDETGEPTERQEELLFTWFIESGETDHERTTAAGDDLPLMNAQKNLWKPASAKDYPGASARVVVVVRDDRDGVGWRSGFARLAEEP